jgi:hypothetical protein
MGRQSRLTDVLAAAACTAMLGVSGPSAQSPETGIIERLTAETHSQAVACGRSGPDCAVSPYELCPSDGQYSARIATPFSRVAAAVHDAVKTGRRPNPMTPGAATRWGVGIFVFPAENSAKANAIQRLEIRRDGSVIQPTTSTVGPLTTRAPDGSPRPLARGFFAFPASAFSPDAEVTIVFVGTSGEMSCTLERSRLQALR